MTRMKVWMLVALVAGGWAIAAARGQDEGSIVGWGDQLVVPQSALTDLVAVAGGYYHSLALKADGSIVAWGAGQCGQSGYPHFGQSCIPAPNTGFVAVAAGFGHSLGRKADRSIVAWGAGQCGQSGIWDYGQSCIPAPNTGFVAVAAGYGHSLGLKSDGSIVAWGDNSHGQLDVPAPNTGFVALAAGGYHSLAIVAPPQPPVLQLKLDIKPNKCPNKIKLGTNAAVWVVIAAQAGFDVQSIDLDSLQLRRADGVGGSLSPDSNPRLVDWATPFDGEPCNCHSAFTDGIDDARTKFHVGDLNGTLQLTGPAGTAYELEMIGQLSDGTPFTARDCILIDRNNGT